MLASLTFRQVREAGLFAWREDHLLYTPTLDAILSAATLDKSDERSRARFDVRASSMSGDEPEMRFGWHHLRECRCVYCRDGRLVLAHGNI